ncbi:MAG: squalene/phytoene synthase family protein [Alphaproteobacteria bacterium]
MSFSDNDDGGARAYCAGAVRDGDHDRWLTTLFAPGSLRGDLLVLYACNLELARTAEVVSEPMLGQIRLQWWREAAAEVANGTPRRHPVVEALTALHRRRPLPLAELNRLIDAREQDLAAEPFADLPAFLDYTTATSAPLARLALAALDAETDQAEPAARAYAIVGLLRALPFWARERRLALPLDMLTEAGLTAEDVYRRRRRPELAQVVEKLSRQAETDLAALRRPQAAALPALLPATLARLHLARLARAGHDPFTLAEQPPPALAAPLRLWWAARRGRP